MYKVLPYGFGEGGGQVNETYNWINLEKSVNRNEKRKVLVAGPLRKELFFAASLTHWIEGSGGHTSEMLRLFSSLDISLYSPRHGVQNPLYCLPIFLSRKQVDKVFLLMLARPSMNKDIKDRKTMWGIYSKREIFTVLFGGGGFNL